MQSFNRKQLHNTKIICVLISIKKQNLIRHVTGHDGHYFYPQTDDLSPFSGFELLKGRIMYVFFLLVSPGAHKIPSIK